MNSIWKNNDGAVSQWYLNRGISATIGRPREGFGKMENVKYTKTERGYVAKQAAAGVPLRPTAIPSGSKSDMESRATIPHPKTSLVQIVTVRRSGIYRRDRR